MEEAVQTERVLETLFQCVSFKKLKELRLVCKYWNKLAAAELPKRSNTLLLDNVVYPKNLKDFYYLELSMKNKDLTVKLPIAVYVHTNAKNDWKLLKDIATHEGWRTRVSRMELDGFLASDLNVLLPFLLDQMPSLTLLSLVKVNMTRVGKSIIPRGFNVPKVSPTKRFSLTSLQNSFLSLDTYDADCGLDPRFLSQCPSLKEFGALVWVHCNQNIAFFELLNKLHSEEVDFMASCDKIRLVIRSNPFQEAGPLETLAQFVNNTQPTALHMDPCNNLNLVYFLTLLQVKLRAFSVEVPTSGGTLCCSNWLLKTLKKFKIFKQLEELSLTPGPDIVGSRKVPEEFVGYAEHNLEKVTTLKIEVGPEEHLMDCEKFRRILEDAAHHLRNVTRLELLDLHYKGAQNPDISRPRFNFTAIFESIRRFSGLREIFCDVHDWSGELRTIGVEILVMGGKGLLEPLSLLAGSRVQTLTVNVLLHYNLSFEMVLLALFMGYEPKLQLNLDLKTEFSALKKCRYSKEEFKETMEKIYRDPRGATGTR